MMYVNASLMEEIRWARTVQLLAKSKEFSFKKYMNKYY